VISGPTALCKGDSLLVELELEYENVSWLIAGSEIANGAVYSDTAFNQSINLAAIVEDENGCIGGTDVDIDALPVPEPKIDDQDILDICQNESEYIFSVNMPSDGEAIYSWETNAGEVAYTQGAAAAINITAPPGTYFISVEETIGIGCSGVDSLTFEVTEGVAPDVAEVERLPAGNILVCLDSTVSCYQWGYINRLNNNQNTLSGQTSQAYVAGESYDPVNRIYYVDIWNGNCEDPAQECTTRCYFNRPPVAVDTESLLSGSLRAFPNPTSGAFTLEVSHAPAGVYWLQAYNAVGQRLLLQKLEIRRDDFQFPVNLGESPAGMLYIVLENTEGQRFSTRVSLQK
jgi:hypothetical protein